MAVSIMKEKRQQRSWKYYFILNRKLLPLKVFMFFYFGGFVALYPYLTIHMKSIGITVAQTGIIYAIYPVCVCLGGPLAGIIADKTGQYKLSLMAFILISIISHMVLYFIPAYSVGQISKDIPITDFNVTTWCAPTASNSFSELTLSLPESLSPETCKPQNLFENKEDGQLLLRNCISSGCQNAPGICQNIPSGRSCANFPYPTFMETTRIPMKTFIFDNHTSTLKSRQMVWKLENQIFCESPDMWKTCYINCELTSPLNLTMQCILNETHGHQFTTFFLYLFGRLLAGLSINLAFTLVDASLIQMVADYDGDVGINRAFGSIGYCIVPPLSGLLIDYISDLNGTGEIDYRPAFYLFALGLGLSIVVLLFTKVQARLPTQNIWKNAVNLLQYKRVLAFLTIFFLIGTAWGFLESFLFWFLDEDLHAPKWLLGLTNTVGGVSGIPFAACMTWIVSKTGYTKLFIFGLFMFGIRFIGYSFIDNYYWVLPLEALEAITCTLPLIGASMYAAGFSPELLATLQGVNSAVHYGFGRGLGSLTGGFLTDSLGIRKSFQIFGGICILYSILHTILHYAYLTKLPKNEPKRPSLETGGLLAHEGKTKEIKSMDAEDYPPPGDQFNAVPVLNPSDPETWGSFVGINQIGHTTEGGFEEETVLRQRRIQNSN